MTENCRAILQEAIDLARDIGLRATAQRLREYEASEGRPHLDFCLDVVHDLKWSIGIVSSRQTAEYGRLRAMIRKLIRLADNERIRQARNVANAAYAANQKLGMTPKQAKDASKTWIDRAPQLS